MNFVPGELTFAEVNPTQGSGTGGLNLRVTLFYTLRNAFRYPISLPSSRWCRRHGGPRQHQ